jgi:hypothetical protein
MAVDGEPFLLFPQLYGARITAEIGCNLLPTVEVGRRSGGADKPDFRTCLHGK